MQRPETIGLTATAALFIPITFITAVSAAKKAPAAPAKAGFLDFLTDEHALYAASMLVLVGAGVMLTCQTMHKSVFEENKALVKCSDGCAGVVAHFLFLIGAITFEFGISNLGNALGLPPAVAVAPSLTGMASVIWSMKLAKKSTIGVDGISGPPHGPCAVLTLIMLTLNANVFRHYTSLLAARAGIEWQTTVGTLYAAAVGVPLAIGAQLRAANAKDKAAEWRV